MNYPTIKLGEILEFIRNGKSCKQNKESFGDKITRIETISDGTINENRVGFFELTDEDKEKYRIKEGDILFSHINSVEHIGKIAIAEKNYDDLYHGMNLLLLRCDKSKIYPKFLYVVLNNYFIKGYWEKVCQKAINQASLNQGKIIEIEIPLPPLETQKAIVAKLDQIFAELDQTKSEIQKNLDNTDELWKSSLNQAFQGDWEVKKISEVVNSIGSGRSRERHDAGKYPIYGSTGIISRTDDFVYDKTQILIARVGANAGFVHIAEGKYDVSDNTLIVDLKNSVDLNYMYYELLSMNLNQYTNGGGQPLITATQIKNLEISVPPLSEQEKIVEHLDQVSQEVKQLKSEYQSQLDNLEELKKSVLDKAFRGELGE